MDGFVNGDGSLAKQAEKPAKYRILEKRCIAYEMLTIPVGKFLGRVLRYHQPFSHAFLLKWSFGLCPYETIW